MIKRIFSAVCATAITASCFMVHIALAEEGQEKVYANNASVVLADTLLDAVCEDELFDGESVTRGEFINTVTTLMKVSGSEVTGSVYNDVTVNHAYAESIKSALELEWISSGEFFRPDEPIRMSEAVKILVASLGYAPKAEFLGGFPAGYYAEADNLELLEGVYENSSEFVMPVQAKVMMYNFLNAEWSDRSYLHTIDGAKFSEASSGRTILEIFYKLYKTEGVINATPYNSFSYSERIRDTKLIEINGETFLYEKATHDLLGKYATAFYNADTDEILAIDTSFENTLLSYDLDDLEFINVNLVKHTDSDNNSEDIELSGGIMTYNGRNVKNISKEYFDGDGYAVFIDNNEDEIYDVVQINSFSYMTVGSVDRYNRMISDEKTGENLNLKNCADEMIKLYDADGEKTNFYGLEPGMVLEILTPEDRSFATIRIIDNVVTGVADGISDESLTIDGIEYNYTKHFSKHYMQNIILGKNNTYYLGYEGRLISCALPSSKYEYGVVIRATAEEGNSVVRMRIYTQRGKMVMYDVDDKLRVDNIKTDPLSICANYDSTVTELSARVIRYMLNSSGKVSRIDTAVEYDAEKEQSADEDDKLVYYPEFYTSMRYRSNSDSFTGKVLLSNAICMMVPQDITSDPRLFSSGNSKSILGHDANYTPHVFDMDEDGYAGFVLFKGDITAFGSGEREYLIEKISRGINSDDEVVDVIECWSAGKYYTLYMADDVSVNKDSGDRLVAGDIVRMKVDAHNNVISTKVDFDYDSFAFPTSLAAGSIHQPNTTPAYWFGIPASISAKGTVSLSTGLNDEGKWDFSAYALRPLSVSTSNIARFDCETKQIRPITYQEIKSYRAYGNMCEYIFMRMNFDIPSMIVVYDNHGRK